MVLTGAAPANGLGRLLLGGRRQGRRSRTRRRAAASRVDALTGDLARHDEHAAMRLHLHGQAHDRHGGRPGHRRWLQPGRLPATFASPPRTPCSRSTSHPMGWPVTTAAPSRTRIGGTALARRLYLLNERISAMRAFELGMVHAVLPAAQLRSHTYEVAAEICRHLPGAGLGEGRPEARTRWNVDAGSSPRSREPDCGRTRRARRAAHPSRQADTDVRVGHGPSTERWGPLNSMRAVQHAPRHVRRVKRPGVREAKGPLQTPTVAATAQRNPTAIVRPGVNARAMQHCHPEILEFYVYSLKRRKESTRPEEPRFARDLRRRSPHPDHPCPGGNGCYRALLTQGRGCHESLSRAIGHARFTRSRSRGRPDMPVRAGAARTRQGPSDDARCAPPPSWPQGTDRRHAPTAVADNRRLGRRCVHGQYGVRLAREPLSGGTSDNGLNLRQVGTGTFSIVRPRSRRRSATPPPSSPSGPGPDTGRADIWANEFAGTPLRSITEMGYSTYLGPGEPISSTAVYQLPIFATPAGNPTFTTLSFQPYSQGVPRDPAGRPGTPLPENGPPATPIWLAGPRRLSAADTVHDCADHRCLSRRGSQWRRPADGDWRGRLILGTTFGPATRRRTTGASGSTA